MRRRLILAALALVVVGMLAFAGSTWRGGADGAAPGTPDSLANPDSAARARAAAVEEPPCVASRIGLPCR